MKSRQTTVNYIRITKHDGNDWKPIDFTQPEMLRFSARVHNGSLVFFEPSFGATQIEEARRCAFDLLATFPDDFFRIEKVSKAVKITEEVLDQTIEVDGVISKE